MKRPTIESLFTPSMLPATLPPRIRLPGPKPTPAARRKPRDELAKVVATMVELAEHVRRLRAGLSIQQAELARRAGVSREWIVALEQGKPTLEAGKLLRTLETLGFELTLTPYDPPPPWMLRATADAEARRAALAAGRRTRRNTRRAKARAVRLAGNQDWGRPDVE